MTTIKTIRHRLCLVMTAVAMLAAFTACGGSDDDENGSGSSDESHVPTALEKALFDTSWKLVSGIYYKKDGTPYIDWLADEALMKYKGAILTFSSDPWISFEGTTSPGFYKLYYNGACQGFWYENSIPSLALIWDYHYDISSSERGDRSLAFGVAKTENITITSTTMRWVSYLDDGSYSVNIYSKASTPYLSDSRNSGGSTGGNTGGSGSAVEKPEIGFYDFSATKTSVTVKFQIYNKDKANVSSARVYYGTTSNPNKSVSATVSGVYITATISGLTKGTEYWVYCQATGSGGSGESDVVKVITNY
ncbi:MAG: hypothetical protein ILA34_07300 [Bacteroidaceae bacterium]|nr:hypothetical protein [Bacteroidaceae bacterium]